MAQNVRKDPPRFTDLAQANRSKSLRSGLGLFSTAIAPLLDQTEIRERVTQALIKRSISNDPEPYVVFVVGILSKVQGSAHIHQPEELVDLMHKGLQFVPGNQPLQEDAGKPKLK